MFDRFQPLPPFQRALKYILSDKFGRGEEVSWVPLLWEKIVAPRLEQIEDEAGDDSRALSHV